jgi:hypothetical protein
MSTPNRKMNVMSTYGIVLMAVFSIAGILWMQMQQPQIPASDPIRVTLHMFSGRPSPFFDGASISEIERRLKDLPAVEEPKEEMQWRFYSIEMPNGDWVQVHDNEIYVSKDRSKAAYLDGKGLKKYLDQVRKKTGMIDPLTEKPFVR